MKIYLCQPSSTNSKVPVIPFAQLVLAAHIEDIADIELSGYSKEGTHISAEEILERIKVFKPDVVGVTVEYAVAHNTGVRLAKMIKEYNPEIKVIAGGHHATFTADALLRTKYIDVIFTGEGELSLRKFVMNNGKKLNEIPGIVYLDGDNVVNTGPTTLIDLDELKPPAYHLLPQGLKPLMGIESSRGCPFNCDFCETRNFFNSGRLRKMSPQHFIDNFKRVVDVTGGGNFMIVDDCFTAHMKGHVKQICEMLIAEDLPISIFIQGRVDDLRKNKDIIPLMTKAKINSVLLGIETINEETLKLMNKGSNYGRESLTDLIKFCEDHGMVVFASMVFGYPNETPKMIMDTIDYLVDLDVTTSNMTIATPIPGSPLYKRVTENNKIITDNFDMYGGMHRVSTEVPEVTPDAATKARKRFYMRPEYVRRIINNALKPDKYDMTTFMPAGLLSHNLCVPTQARPSDSQEWIQLFEGLKLVVDDNLPKGKSKYSAVVKCQFEDIAFYMTVENGYIVKLTENEESYDVLMESSIDIFTDLFIWSPLDIVSALMKGQVNTPNIDLKAKIEFTIWMTEIQNVLRWALTMKQIVPAVRPELESWIKESSDRYDKFKILFNNVASLFIGSKEIGGIVIDFGNENRIINNISVINKYDKTVSVESIIDEQTLEKLLTDNFSLLFDILEKLEIDDKLVVHYSFLAPKDYFDVVSDRFIPEKAANVSLAVQYVIKMDTLNKETWSMKIEDSKLSILNTEVDNPTAIVKLDLKYFLQLINGKVTPLDLFTTGKMDLKGLPQTMIQLASCFNNIFGDIS